MKVVLATPLYPPDIAPPAPYIKELATRLKEAYDVHIVTYGYIPEAISGVTIETVNKRRRKLSRLISFTLALYHHGKRADVLFVDNGLSVELPAFLCSLVIRTPIVFHVGDVSASTKSQKQFLPRIIQQALKKRARATVYAIPMPKPEVLPFTQVTSMEAYENSWKEHLTHIKETLTYA